VTYLVAAVGITAALTVTAIALVIVVKFGSFVTAYFRAPTTVYVQSASWDGQAALEVEQTLRDRFVRWSKDLDSHDDRGLEVLFAADHLDRAKQISDLEVEVAGIKLGGIVTLMQAIAPSPYYTLAASGETKNGTHRLTFSLSRAGNVEQQWYLDEPFAVGNDAEREQAKERVLDRGVFRVIFDRSRTTQRDRSRFPNERALSAFVRGTQALNAYFESRRQPDLTASVAALRELRWEMPAFNEGLDLLALALAEDRRELEAIEIYDFLLGSHEPVAKATIAAAADLRAKQRLLQLELNRAQAHLFLYQPASAAKSAAHLEGVLTLLADRALFAPAVQSTTQQAAATPGAAAPPATTPADDPKLASLRAYALAQLSDVYGHLFSIVDPDMSDADAVLAMARLNPQPNRTDRAVFIAAVWNAHLALLKEAQDARNAAAVYWAQNEREKQALDRLLASSRGYTKTLHAAWSAPNADALRVEIEDGVRDLRQAGAAEPNQYSVLQNLATAYSEPYFDVNGDLLFTAIELYKRSLELKANDYWGYYRLARIYGRQLDLGWAAADTLMQLEDNVAKARELRPGDSGIRALELRAKMWKWSTSDDQPQDTQRQGIETVLARNTGNDWTWARVVWQVHKLRRFEPKAIDATANQSQTDPPEKQFETARKSVEGAIAAASSELAKSDASQHWEMKHQIGALNELLAEVQKAKYETRAAISPPF
jgi:hypothetical protein